MKSMRDMIKLMEGTLAAPATIGQQPQAGANQPGGAGGEEAQTQTRGTVGRNADYAAFDAAQTPATEESVEMDEAHVDSCRQTNPADCRTACAMEEGMEGMDMQMGSPKVEEYLALFSQLTGSFVEPHEALDVVMSRASEDGLEAEDMDAIHDAIMSQHGGEDTGAADLPIDEEVDDDTLLRAVAALFGPEIWNSDSMQDIAQELQDANPSDEEIHHIITTGSLPERLSTLTFNAGDSHQFDEDFNLQNGYDDIEKADGNDYFPNGADSPVVSKVGPSGARQGDNPEQKKMQVAEVHKELVYGYRNYLKEAAEERKVTHAPRDPVTGNIKMSKAGRAADTEQSDREYIAQKQKKAAEAKKKS